MFCYMCLDSLPKCCTYIEQIFSDVTAILLPAGIIYAATIPTNPATSIQLKQRSNVAPCAGFSWLEIDMVDA